MNTQTDGLLDDYEEPEFASLAEAERYRDEMVSRIQGIEQQLGSHNLNPEGGGYRMPLDEWEDWRHRAKGAKNHYTRELRRVKAWIREAWATGAARSRAATPTSGFLSDLPEKSTAEILGAIRVLVRELEKRAKNETD